MSDAAKTPADAKPRGLLIPVIGAAVLSAAIAGGAVFFLTPKHAAPAESAEAAAGGHEAAAAEGHGGAEGKGEGKGEGAARSKGGATYLPMAPPFVVNLNDGEASRFLQVDMEVMSHDAGSLEAVKLHTPQIRNSVLMLLSAQKAADIETREGKEALQKKVLEEFQRILTAETGKPIVEAVFFTSFVMQ